MTKLAIITKEQHRDIYGKFYADSMYFNPVLDKDGNIVISEQEVNQLDNKELPWVADLVLKEPTDILKTDWTKEQWLTYEKEQAELRASELAAELEKLKTAEIKPK